MTSTKKYTNMKAVYTSVLFAVPLLYTAMVFVPVLAFSVIFLLATISFISYSSLNTKILLTSIRNTDDVHKLGFMGLSVSERVILSAWYIVFFTALYLLFPYDPSYPLFWAIDQQLFGQLFALQLSFILTNNFTIAKAYGKIHNEILKRIREIEKSTKED